MTEKQLQKAIIEYLNYNGCFVWMVNAGKIRIGTGSNTRFFNGAPTGHSDIQGIHKKTGRFIAIEVKKPGKIKNVTTYQSDFLNKIAMAGGIAGVATSCDEALKIIESSTI